MGSNSGFASKRPPDFEQTPAPLSSQFSVYHIRVVEKMVSKGFVDMWIYNAFIFSLLIIYYMPSKPFARGSNIHYFVCASKWSCEINIIPIFLDEKTEAQAKWFIERPYNYYRQEIRFESRSLTSHQYVLYHRVNKAEDQKVNLDGGFY